MNEQQKIVIDKSIRPQLKKQPTLIETIKISVATFKQQIKYLEARIAEAESVLKAVETIDKEVKTNG